MYLEGYTQNLVEFLRGENMLPNYRGQEKVPEKYSIGKEYWIKGWDWTCGDERERSQGRDEYKSLGWYLGYQKSISGRSG